MDPRLFSLSPPGRLVRITRDPSTGNEHAFVPHPLPPAWDFPEELWPVLTEATHQLGILEGIGRTLPNPGILLRPLENREAIKSSRLEGTYVTATELLVFEMQPKQSKSQDDPANFRREVFNYRLALQQGMTSELPLSLRLIRDLHKTLMTRVRGKDRTPGMFRVNQVAIGSNHRFVPPPPEDLTQCLDPFEKYLHVKASKYQKMVDCFLVHYQFETIHPFNDGNGRVGRLLLAMMLKEHCSLSKPWIYMSEYFEKHNDEYARKLFNVSAVGDWNGWIRFCLEGVVIQARDTIQRCEKLLLIREGFTKRITEVGGSTRLHQIVEGLFQSPFVRIVDLSKQLGVTYPTAKADVERLVVAGILSELKTIVPKTYYAPEVFNVSYEAMG
jgi:Fic family protein